ncbi:MAG: hypothetical protein A2458_02905 [Candidatus Kerfeldbacteria bacterium RIFOXYC2_FULL_38_9]|uniref:Heat-inducible transcription repressor HrcA n=1 Tax=Candidatus Kerfeldbacteria bacterium RIFOXYB2_FULL_38_14 TaxID=1798547 RepID=A0A1G2BG25_9BACT|nr:MAG: hypothetical protein A2319_01795 [Candidatus Kerfeldbacteria bacterium RIFOXYB2_FULL_38_14]OGY88407.1 MAG: hypothetical protein A2458_02905 [Candidatus Kerfeldbacteria bacterium RIFOXYC2_FULL_38_9]
MDKLERQALFLQAIVQEYIKTAKPVSSKALVEEYEFDFSPATIRNDMAELEKQNLIIQPHPSAGRVPTERGYQYYIQHFLKHQELTTAKKRPIAEAVQKKAFTPEERVKRLAKTLAALTKEVIVVSLSDGEAYYTGIAHIFSQPEFTQGRQLMLEVSSALDELDKVMSDLQTECTGEEVRVLIGQENPFAKNCSMLISEYDLAEDNSRGMLGILGPMRMDYDTNIAILNYIEKLMDERHEEH